MRNQITYLSVFAFLCTFLITPAKAQDYYASTYEAKRVSLGITATPTLGWMRYGDADGYSGTSKLGFQYGLLADFLLTENYYFSTGLLINTLPSSVNFSGPALGDDGITQKDYRLQYADIPVSVKLKSTQRYFRSYYGQFGFTGGVRVGGREKASPNGSRTALGSDANVFRLALQIGGGIEWQLDHNLKLATGVSFNNGFTRAIKQGEPKNSYFALNLGVFF